MRGFWAILEHWLWEIKKIWEGFRALFKTRKSRGTNQNITRYLKHFSYMNVTIEKWIIMKQNVLYVTVNNAEFIPLTEPWCQFTNERCPTSGNWASSLSITLFGHFLPFSSLSTMECATGSRSPIQFRNLSCLSRCYMSQRGSATKIYQTL